MKGCLSKSVSKIDDVSCSKNVPSRANPPIPPFAALPPAVDKPFSQTSSYTLPQRSPAEMETTCRASWTVTPVIFCRSKVIPPSIFAAPGVGTWPPPRIASFGESGNWPTMARIVATSSLEVGGRLLQAKVRFRRLTDRK